MPRRSSSTTSSAPINTAFTPGAQDPVLQNQAIAMDPQGMFEDLGSINPMWHRYARVLAARGVSMAQPRRGDNVPDMGSDAAIGGIAADPTSTFNTSPYSPGFGAQQRVQRAIRGITGTGQA